MVCPEISPDLIREVEIEARGVLYRARGLPLEFDDLVQEGLIAIERLLKRWDPSRSSVTTFMKRRVRGAMMDAIRTQRRKLLQNLTPRTTAKTVGWCKRGAFDPRKEIVQRDLRRVFRQRLREAAPPRLWRFYVMHYILSLTLWETAAEFGRTEGWASRVVKECLVPLARRIAEELRQEWDETLVPRYGDRPKYISPQGILAA